MRKPFRVTEAMRSRDRRTAALGYAKAGISVLALQGITHGKCDCGDPDCQSPGKHPLGAEFPHGHLDATRDPDRIEKIFSTHPNVNFGIVPNGDLIVVDVDGAVGETSIQSIPISKTPTVKTGRGRHLFFKKNKEPAPQETTWRGLPPRRQGLRRRGSEQTRQGRVVSTER
jgi:hypothetical protein